MRTVLAVVGAVAAGGCMQRPPHGIVRVTPGAEAATGAILVMPTTCVPEGVWADLCEPRGWVQPDQAVSMQLAATFGPYVDPALRLKLEFAGYTLAEGAAMRLTTGERTDHAQVSEGGGAISSYASTQTTAGATVADLGPADVRAVARSLALTGIVTSTLTLRPAGFGEVRGVLTVTLWDVATSAPRWVAECGENMYDVTETSIRLAGCVGNGILAALAPDNLIGRAL